MTLKMSDKDLKCSRCGNNAFFRVKRHWWMRLVPTSRLYHCDVCSTPSFVLFNKKHDGAITVNHYSGLYYIIPPSYQEFAVGMANHIHFV